MYMPVSGPAIQHCPTLASALEELQNDRGILSCCSLRVSGQASMLGGALSQSETKKKQDEDSGTACEEESRRGT